MTECAVQVAKNPCEASRLELYKGLCPGKENNAGDCSIFLHGFVRLLATAVLRIQWIHDILVWIRIRIRGSMPLTNGSGSGSGFGLGSCYFRH
jgi:hypothetical protein